MKKRWFAGLLVLALTLTLGCPVPARADGQRVVTIGADLTTDQRNMILRYFGISDDPDVQFLTITNKDEHEHLDSFVPKEQIGTRTISCAYVSPTTKGGIRVKTANLSWVTSNMIATTLSTAGIVNCDVIAAAPFKVSGTGALTGVIMAYEEASGEELDEVKKALATLELITTGRLAERIGQDAATEIVNEIKMRIIRDGITDQAQIAEIVEELVHQLEARELKEQELEDAEAEQAEEEVELEEVPEMPVDAEMAEDDDDPEALGAPAELTEDELDMLKDLAEQIAEQSYDYEDMKDTLERVEENVKTSEGIIAEPAEEEEEIQAVELEMPEEETDSAEEIEEIEEVEAAGTAEPIEEEEDSILFYTDDSALGADAILDSTNKEDNLPAEEAEEVPSEEAEEDLPELVVEMEDEEVLDEAGTDQPEKEVILQEPEEEEEEIPEEPVEEVFAEELPEEEPVEDNKAEEPAEEPVEEEIEEIEEIEEAGEEIPVEEAEEEILTSEAVIEANPAVKGLVRIYVPVEDAVPVSGTLKVKKAGGKAWSTVDLSDPYYVAAAPLDGVVTEDVDFACGTVITVVTEMETSDKKFFGAEKEITADFTFEAGGETYHAETSAAVPASEAGIVLAPAGTDSLASGQLYASLWSTAKKGSAQITAEDPEMAAADRTEISFTEEDPGVTLYFFREGTASFDVTFLTKSGDLLDTAGLLVTVSEVPDWSPEEIEQIRSMAEAALPEEDMPEEEMAGDAEDAEDAGEIEEIEEIEEVEELE